MTSLKVGRVGKMSLLQKRGSFFFFFLSFIPWCTFTEYQGHRLHLMTI